MKKILLLILLAFSTSAYSQESVSDMFKSKEKKAEEAAAQNKKSNDDLYGLYAKKSIAKLYEDQAEAYLNKSNNYQYGALGCAAASAGLLIGYGSMAEKFELNDEGEPKLTGKAKGLIIGGSIIGIIAVILEVNALQCKVNARKCFRLQSGENGAGLAFVF